MRTGYSDLKKLLRIIFVFQICYISTLAIYSSPESDERAQGLDINLALFDEAIERIPAQDRSSKQDIRSLRIYKTTIEGNLRIIGAVTDKLNKTKSYYKANLATLQETVDYTQTDISQVINILKSRHLESSALHDKLLHLSRDLSGLVDRFSKAENQ